MKEKEGYKFLTRTLGPEELIEKFKKEQKPLTKSTTNNEEEVEEEQENMDNLIFPNLPPVQQN